jgi:hypothetical protein
MGRDVSRTRVRNQRRTTNPAKGSATLPAWDTCLATPAPPTTDQQPQLQVDALQRAGCYRVFTETASGARSDRPAHGQLLDRLRPGDTLVVWRLDRLGRSLRYLVDTVTSLAERGIGFRSLQEATETPPPAASSSSMSLWSWPSSNATASANERLRGWLPPGPAAAAAAGRRC